MVAASQTRHRWRCRCRRSRAGWLELGKPNRALKQDWVLLTPYSLLPAFPRAQAALLGLDVVQFLLTSGVEPVVELHCLLTRQTRRMLVDRKPLQPLKVNLLAHLRLFIPKAFSSRVRRGQEKKMLVETPRARQVGSAAGRPPNGAFRRTFGKALVETIDRLFTEPRLLRESNL